MNSIWFKKLGWAYLPVQAIGVLITLASLEWNVMFFTAIDRNSHSFSDMLMVFLFISPVYLSGRIGLQKNQLNFYYEVKKVFSCEPY